MVNGNSGVIGIASDLIGGLKDNLLGAEGVLTDVNMLGMARPLATINIAEDIKAQGGLLPSLQTGIKKMNTARKGGRTGAVRKQPAKRYRPTPPPTTPSEPTAQILDQPEEVEIIL